MDKLDLAVKNLLALEGYEVVVIQKDIGGRYDRYAAEREFDGIPCRYFYFDSTDHIERIKMLLAAAAKRRAQQALVGISYGM